jgi:hypothetical protein
MATLFSPGKEPGTPKPAEDPVLTAWMIKGAAEVEDDLDEVDTPCSIIATPAPMQPTPLQLPHPFPVPMSAGRVVQAAVVLAALVSAVLLVFPPMLASPAADAPIHRRCIDELTCWTIRGSDSTHRDGASSSQPGDASMNPRRGALRAWRSSRLDSPAKGPCIDPMTCWSKKPVEKEQPMDAKNLDYFGWDCHDWAGWEASVTCWSGWPLAVPGAVAGHVLI